MIQCYTEVTFGRGSLGVCPSGALWAPRNSLTSSIGPLGCPPGAPPRPFPKHLLLRAPLWAY
eukprot:14821363-Heterocapsa_arctica.AAC.1